MNSSQKNVSGFTLVELSIVLVIIGLIVGGILVGQDMIKAAEVRSTISQIRAYNAAINTFRDKYRYLPGDISSTAATNFGFVTRGGTAGHGDGNGLLEGGAATLTAIQGETGLIWVDMNKAGLLDGAFTLATDAAFASALTADTIKNVLPQAKLGRGNLVTAYASGGYNYYEIIGVTSATTAGVPTTAKAMTPLEASNIDTKVDDGAPTTGSAVATDPGAAFNAVATVVAAATGVCAATGPVYNTATNTTASPWATTPSCGLRVRFN